MSVREELVLPRLAKSKSYLNVILNFLTCAIRITMTFKADEEVDYDTKPELLYGRLVRR